MATQLNTIYNFRSAMPLETRVHPEPSIFVIIPLARIIFGLGHSVYVETIKGLNSSIRSFYDVNPDNNVTKKVHPDYVNAVLKATSIGLLYFNPYAVTVVSEVQEIYKNAIQCSNDLGKKEFFNAFKETVHIADKCIFIASLLTGGPQLIVISIVSRSIFELYHAKQFYNKGMYFEASILAALSGLRCSAIAKTYKHEIADFVRDFRANIPG